MDRHSPSPAPVLNWFCKIQYCFFRPLIVVGKLFCIESHPRLLPFQLAIATWPLSTTKLSSFSHFPPNSISILLQPHIYDFMPTYDFSSASSGSTIQMNLIAGWNKKKLSSGRILYDDQDDIYVYRTENYLSSTEIWNYKFHYSSFVPTKQPVGKNEKDYRHKIPLSCIFRDRRTSSHNWGCK